MGPTKVGRRRRRCGRPFDAKAAGSGGCPRRGKPKARLKARIVGAVFKLPGSVGRQIPGWVARCMFTLCLGSSHDSFPVKCALRWHRGMFRCEVLPPRVQRLPLKIIKQRLCAPQPFWLGSWMCHYPRVRYCTGGGCTAFVMAWQYDWVLRARAGQPRWTRPLEDCANQITNAFPMRCLGNQKATSTVQYSLVGAPQLALATYESGPLVQTMRTGARIINYSIAPLLGIGFGANSILEESCPMHCKVF